MSFAKDFKAFAVKGNVVDMAVGIVIGAAFGKIIASFVKDILMPPIGMLMGGVDFKTLGWVMKEAVLDASGAVLEPAVVMTYGNFIQTLVDFIIIALAIFMMIRWIMSMKKKEEAAPAAPPAPSKEEVLLGEIRDLMKESKK